MKKDKNNKIEYIYLSDVLAAMLGATLLDLSDPKEEKAFKELAQETIIYEHKKGNLSFYANNGSCIDDALSILSKKDELRISENQKDLEVGNYKIFPSVLLDPQQVLGIARKNMSLEIPLNKKLKS